MTRGSTRYDVRKGLMGVGMVLSVVTFGWSHQAVRRRIGKREMDGPPMPPSRKFEKRRAVRCVKVRGEGLRFGSLVGLMLTETGEPRLVVWKEEKSQGAGTSGAIPML